MGKLFSDIYGQKHAVSILSAQLQSGNLSHGYLFLGNEGTGKTFLAFEFAKYLLCPNHTEDDCDNCTKFLHGSHPDFIYIDGSEGIKIETVREVIERINLSPNFSKFKVLFLSQAENLGIEAANALLKTLEEPPSDSIIILSAISEKSLPETIVSRAQKIKLSPLSDNDIKKILAKEFSDDKIEAIISYSEGSAGEARKLLESSDYHQEKEGIFKDVEALFHSKSVVEKFKIIEKHEKAKNMRPFFDVFSGVVFNTLKKQVGETAGPGLENPVPSGVLLAISHKILKIYADLDYNINLRLAMESLILEHLLYD